MGYINRIRKEPSISAACVIKILFSHCAQEYIKLEIISDVEINIISQFILVNNQGFSEMQKGSSISHE